MSLYLRTTIIISAIIGAAFGLLSVVPFFKIFPVLLNIAVGGYVVHYLKKNHFVGILTQEDGAAIGAIAGFISTVALFVVNLPIVAFFGLFKLYPNQTTRFLVGIDFFAAILFIACVGLLSALLNAFSGFIVNAVYRKKEEMASQENQSFHIEL